MFNQSVCNQESKGAGTSTLTSVLFLYCCTRPLSCNGPTFHISQRINSNAMLFGKSNFVPPMQSVYLQIVLVLFHPCLDIRLRLDFCPKRHLVILNSVNQSKQRRAFSGLPLPFASPKLAQEFHA